MYRRNRLVRADCKRLSKCASSAMIRSGLISSKISADLADDSSVYFTICRRSSGKSKYRP